jgi:hypothetical protein
MLRIAGLASSLAILAASSASAASIHISTVGKSLDQVKAEVVKAAEQLCRTQTSNFSFGAQVERACVSATVRSALGQYYRTAQPNLAAR